MASRIPAIATRLRVKRPDGRAIGQWIVRKITHNWLVKLASVGVAIGLWGFVNLGARESESSMFVPIELENLPPQLLITNPLPDTVGVRLRGPRTILGTMDPRRQRIELDLGNVKAGSTTFKLYPEMLNLPRGVTVTRMSPVQLTIDVERILERTLPVVTNFAGAVPAGYRVSESELSPQTVAVSGPASIVNSLRNVSTGPLHLPPTSGNFEQSIELERPADLVRLVPDRVVVHGRLEEIVVTQDFRNVEIGIHNAPPQVRMRPKSVDVTVRGLQRVVKDLHLSAQNFYVDLDGVAGGTHKVKIQQSVPTEGIEVIDVRPSEATVETEPVPAPKHPARKGKAKR
jgi:YbbR domain-containing protein